MKETKRITYFTDINEYILDLEYFGWEIEEEDSDSNSVILIRYKDIPNYKELKELEKKYEFYRNSRSRYEDINVLLAILLFSLSILPGAIYLIYKAFERVSIDEENEELKIKMNETLNEAYELNE